MKAKFFTTLFLGLFLINFASALSSYVLFEDQTEVTTIVDGESIKFKAFAITNEATISLNANMYDSNGNLVHGFGTFSGGCIFSKEFQITSDMYSVGSFKISVQSVDSGNNIRTNSIYLTVIPAQTNTAPILTLSGSNPQEIILGNPYLELGATAYDLEDGDLTSSIGTDNQVNVNTVGTYQVHYSVKDSDNNLVSFSRTVNVIALVDDTVPVITLLGDNPQETILGNAYLELYATALDETDGDLTTSIIIDSSAVNTAIVGTYTVTYNVADSSGNIAAEKSRTVNVVEAPFIDTTAPIITMLGNTPLAILLNSVYTDVGATALDETDGDLTTSIINVSNVDTTTIGTYQVTYNVADVAGNNAVEVVRTVNVVEELDTTAPIIIIISPKAKTYYDKDMFFKVQLDEDAVTTFSLDGKSNVTMTKTGDFVFQYDRRVSYDTHELIFYATDAAGNVGTAKVTFKVRKKSNNDDEEENETVVINSYYEEPKNTTVEAVTLSKAKEKPKSMLGWIIVLFLGVGILIMLLIIILMKKEIEKKPDGIYESADDLYENSEAQDADSNKVANNYSSADELY